MKTYLKILLIPSLIFSLSLQAQDRSDVMKRQGQSLMLEGRYEEAIDQFNKFIAANPRIAEGYHLRALCYEQKVQYQYSVIDLRHARRLDSADIQIKQDLDRLISIWYRQLYQKIDRYKRDIAANPNNPFVYLEIGKSYRWLEEWRNAEEWYDEYLKRDNFASPDEIIKYTEILTKTSSIVKGERILKKYTQRYPKDWRIWSRYGYFLLWLGKNKIAQDAFKISLGFKPFFKEAAEGLELAKRKSYSDLNRYRASDKIENNIDRFFRILNQNPDDDKMRSNLIDELVTAKRYEEAFQQFQYLSPAYRESEKKKNQFETVMEFRDSTFNLEINHYTELLKNNPTDKETVLKLAKTYGNLFYYDSAIEILSEYLQDIPDDQDLDVRFIYCQYCAGNYEWEKAITQIDKLLKLDPDNLDYQLLRGQTGVWAINDLPVSEKYLLNVVNNRPNELKALTSLISLYVWQKNLQEAKKYLEIAKQIDPKNPDVVRTENYLAQTANTEQKVFEIKSEAEKFFEEGKCYEALIKYDEYISTRTSLSREELIIYAAICSCSKNYSKAIDVYTKLLEGQFDLSIALLRAKSYYFNNDSTKANIEFENLRKIIPVDDATQLLLADAYAETFQLEKTEKIYAALKLKASSEEERQSINRRLLLLGEYFVRAKNYDKANSIFDQVESESIDTDLSKDIILRKIFMADELAQDKKYAEADDLFDQLNDSVKEDSLKKQIYLHHLFVGDHLAQDKKLDDAEEVYDKLNGRITSDDLKNEVFNRKLFLGDFYAQEEMFGTAKNIYNSLRDETTDTSKIRIVNERIMWLPSSGLSQGFSGIKNFFSLFLPRNITLTPYSDNYFDSQKFQSWNYGLQLEAAFIGFLSLGASLERMSQNNLTLTRNFTRIKGLAAIYLSNFLTVSGGYGIITTSGEPDEKNVDVSLKYEKPDEYFLSVSYENTDARMILYSYSLIPFKINAKFYRLNSVYNFNNIFRLSGFYNYFALGDNNEGNDLQFRAGKWFMENGVFGYEYCFADFSFISTLYYSPQNFDSHSLWTEWTWTFSKLKIKAGGKIGYAASADFIIRDLFGEVIYNPLSSLIITGRIGYGNNPRYGSSYRNISASVMAYWSVY